MDVLSDGQRGSLLSNEKFRGGALIQKRTALISFQRNRLKNTGQLPRFYVENDHEVISCPHDPHVTEEEIKLAFEKPIYP